MTIWKYPLQCFRNQEISMPGDYATILCVHEQDGSPTIWAVVDPSSPMQTRYKVHVIGTGSPFEQFNAPTEYVGTAFCGPLVWHVFAEKLS